MKTRMILALLASALVAHGAAAQPSLQGIDGTDLLRAQLAALGDTGPSPAPLHDLSASATQFAVWNFEAQAYDTIRFVRHPVPNAHPQGWSKFLRLWVEEAEILSGHLGATTLDSLAHDMGLNLPYAFALSWDAGVPAHPALDSTRGTDVLLLDIQDGYDPARGGAWVAGFMDRCDTKVWVPAGCPWEGSGNQASILYVDAWPQVGRDPAWVGLMSGGLYGRRVSSVWGPGKLELLEYGVGQWGQGAFSPRWDYERHPQLCAELRQDLQTRALALAALPPDPASPDVQVVQDRAALFLRFIDHLDRHFDRDISRVDEHGNRIRGYGTSILDVVARSPREEWTIVDTIVHQWNTVPSDSMMRDGHLGPSVPWHPPEGLATRDELIFSYHEANYRGWRWVGQGHTVCEPAMGSAAVGASLATEAFALSRGGVHYIDLADLSRPFSFTLDRKDTAGDPVPVQVGVVYYDGADTLTQRLGWMSPDSLAGWPWALPDSVVAKDLAGLILVGGSEGNPVSLSYAIGGPTAAEADTPPAGFTLHGNYPNPFNPTTTVRYTLPTAGRVRLAVYDVLGREVALLQDDIRNAGTHQVRLEARGWASGMYLYRLTTPDGSATRRMVLAR